MTSHFYTKTRDPNSFNNVETIEVSQRTLYRKYEHEDNWSLYSPETISEQEFLSMVYEVGEPWKVESYFDHYTNLNVVRGGVIKNGKLFFYCLYHDGRIYEEVAKSTIAYLKMSGVEYDL